MLILVFGDALGQEWSPATFGDKGEDFLQNLSLPRLDDGDLLIIRCAAGVTRSGLVIAPVCHEDLDHPGHSRMAVAEVHKEVNLFRIQSAKVEGRAVRVWFNFSVVYRQVEDDQQKQLLHNNLYNVDELGVNYIAAQRYNTRSWGRSCSISQLPVLLEAKISEVGEISERGYSGESESDRCVSAIDNAVSKSSFIPAHLDGNPVESTYIEVFFKSAL